MKSLCLVTKVCSKLTHSCSSQPYHKPGLSIRDFKRLVAKYYPVRSQTETQATSLPTEDRKLLERVWKWLTAHPDLLVGPDGQNQSLALSEIELLDNFEATQPDLNNDSKPNRLFATEELMWMAVAGHQKDIKLVPPFQFTILCIIAAAGENGITQPDVVRISGQDKRSVPKRTDILAEKGYIEKKPVYIKSAKTSLLIHRKFQRASDTQIQPGPKAEAPGEIFQGQQLDFNTFVGWLSTRLQDSTIITEDDLMSELELPVSNKWQRKVVRKAIDKLVIAGIVECFNAPSEFITRKGTFRRLHCVRLIYNPTPENIHAAFKVEAAQITSYRIKRAEELERQIKQAKESGASHDGPTEPDLEEEHRFDSEVEDGQDDIAEGHVEQSTPPLFNSRPQSSVKGLPYCAALDIGGSLTYNMIHSIIHSGGCKGVTSAVSRVTSLRNSADVLSTFEIHPMVPRIPESLMLR
jgi:hypothetical protein